ncbi:MAG: acetyl-CoA carboxylase biotin carboxyl carrier protein subunit [Chloroflexi bacterium]|nr:acetyl-CoA carboxylase biotin carboxyl carrier protein subunit [Chloroflexota bacterium]
MAREVIRVETTGVGDGRAGATAPSATLLADLARVADEVLPALVARLGVSGLGEIEVRHDGWHVRVRRGAASGTTSRPTPTGSTASSGTAAGSGTAAHSGTAAGSGTGAHSVPHEPTVSSPGVGYVSYRSGLAVGHRVARGDAVGWVDVLGVRQEVVAPIEGVVGELLVAAGDPVEFGQSILRLLAADGATSARASA